MKMHDGEADIDAALVRELVAAQFPRLAALPVTSFASTGTVNAIYRLGSQLYARLPRTARWAADLEAESRWLPRLAPHLSLRVPEPVAMGRPAGRYRLPWAIYQWIEGQPYADGLAGDERQAARDLARFVTELRALDTAGAPRAGRRPLRELDAGTRAGITAAGEDIDGGAALAAWELALEAPAWDGRTPVWIHADLLRPNLLVDGGRLRAVIDFGAAGAGDPAADLIAAWSVFGPAGREAFRAALDPGDGAWERARGVALHQAVMLIPYYRTTNPGMAALGRRTVGQVLADPGAPPELLPPPGRENHRTAGRTQGDARSTQRRT
jgi:aminoglycoside phosphotransferase (APT) family kinase protein